MTERPAARTSPLAESDGGQALARAAEAVNRVVVDKPDQVRLAFCALLAGGHLLIEDLPGVGKTTLAHAMARVVGGRWQRIQFTSDMLPADIVGISVYHSADDHFEFRPGPVFSNIVLADEINRATPRTQSALLEAMAEGQVTVDGHTHALPRPFYVIATQNPLDLVGTYPLPDSQLDRFLLRISLGYPDAEHERRLMTQPDRRDLLADLSPCLPVEELPDLMERVRSIHVSEAVLDYIQALVRATRDHPGLRSGLSPRAALALVAVSRAHALMAHRDYCLPEDVKAVFPALAGHRLQPAPGTDSRAEAMVESMLDQTPVA